MSNPSDDDADFYDEEDLLNILPEETEDLDPDDPSEDGIDESFLQELGKAKQTPFKRPIKYFVFLLKGEATKRVKFANLPHPKTGSLAKFIINSEGKILEIQRTGGLSSWFLNDKSLEDGSLFLTSIVDPLFLLLPIADKARRATSESNGVFVSGGSMFDNVDSNSASKLSPHVTSLSLLCDTKSVDNATYYRLNEEKVVTWLQFKLERLCEHLEQIPDVSSLVRAQASNFRSRGSKLTTLELVKIAIGFLGEYVEKKWLTALENKIGLSAAEATSKAQKVVYATEEEVAPRQKRAHPSNGYEQDFAKDALTPPAKKKTNIHAARLEKVDKRGMSPITSFFKKVEPKS